MGIGEDGPRTMALAAESFAAGPVGTLVVSGSDDGRASELQIVDTSAGCAWSVGSERDVVRRATLEPSGEALVEHRVSRRTRADLGIWRRPLDGSAPTLILPPIDPDGRFGRTFLTDLGWSFDVDRLVVLSCG